MEELQQLLFSQVDDYIKKRNEYIERAIKKFIAPDVCTYLGISEFPKSKEELEKYGIYGYSSFHIDGNYTDYYFIHIDEKITRTVRVIDDIKFLCTIEILP